MPRSHKWLFPSDFPTKTVDTFLFSLHKPHGPSILVVCSITQYKHFYRKYWSQGSTYEREGMDHLMGSGVLMVVTENYNYCFWNMCSLVDAICFTIQENEKYTDG